MKRVTAFTVAIALAVIQLSCFSDRSSGPGTDLEECNVTLPPEAFGSSLVIIRDFTFVPQQVSVRPGSKVTWVNCDIAGSEAHTSTANAGQWNSQLLQPGATFTREFPTAGSFPYHCEPHPIMTGTVTVQ